LLGLDILARASQSSDSSDTLVQAEVGLIPISEINIGDMVWAYNEKTGGQSLQEVTHLIRGEGEKSMIDIVLNTGEVTKTTANHPFYLAENDRWVDASELTEKDVLLSILGSPLGISGVSAYQLNTKVYNLTVNNDHTYYVGESGVLNHNAQKVCSLKGLLLGQKKPNYEINDKHVAGKQSAGQASSLLVPDADIAFTRAIKAESDPKKWYARSLDGKSIYMYSEDVKKDVAHFSANTSDVKSPLKWKKYVLAKKRHLLFI